MYSKELQDWAIYIISTGEHTVFIIRLEQPVSE